MERRFHFFKKNHESYCQYRRMIAMLSIVTVSFFVFDGFPSNGKRGNQSVREQIDTIIEKYILDQYEKQIFPDCVRFAEMPASYDKLREQHRIQNKLTRLLKDVMEYGEKVSASYDGQADYIRSKIYSFMEGQQMKVFKLQYPDGDPDWTHGFVIDPDSAWNIAKELNKNK